MNKPKSVDKLVVEQFNQELDALLAGQTTISPGQVINWPVVRCT